MWLRWMALSAVLGCRGSALSKGDDSDVDIMDGPTFYQDVLPIVGENCQACHNETASMGSAFPLESYAHVAPIAEVLLAKMQPEGDPDDDPFFMPPFYARTNLECATWLDWKGTYQASQTDVSIFEAWIAAGKQEGDPESPADFVPREVTTLEGDDLIEVAYHGSYTVPEPEPDNYDSFRCFAVETSDGGQIGLTEHALAGLVAGADDEGGLLEDLRILIKDTEGLAQLVVVVEALVELLEALIFGALHTDTQVA